MPVPGPVFSPPAERALLEHLDRLLPVGAPSPGQVLAPVRVVVASRSMRLGLLRRVMAHRGRAIVGLSVQTLGAVGAEILERAGQPSRAGDALVQVLVRRRVAGQATLDPVLGTLDDGAAAVVRPVLDLLAAGFQAETDAAAAAQLLAELAEGNASTAQLLRAIAVIDVAARTRQDLAALGMEVHADALRRAAARLRQDPGCLGPGRLLLHGFTDAAGAEAELLSALEQAAGARTVLPAASSSDVVSSLHLVSAASPQAQARHAARQAQAWIAEGVVPEDIAIVAADASAWAARLRPELWSLGVPWSGVGAHAPAGPGTRRIRALGAVVARLGECPLDSFVDALVLLRGAGRVPPEDLRLGLRALGLVRLRQLAELDVERVLAGRRSLPLPARLGVETAEAEDGLGLEPEHGLPRRRLPAAALRAAALAASGMVSAFETTQPRTLTEWLTVLSEQAGTCLGWGDPDASWRALESARASLLERVPGGFSLSRDELRVLLMPVLEGAALGPVGGEGGGVQVLNAVEARGRGFARTMVLGLNRGELPRPVEQDPLLPDGLRRRLRALLPDLALLERRREVEHEGFMALLSGAAQVYLLWSTADDNGRLTPQSPMIEHLRIERPDLPLTRLPVPGGRQDPPGAEPQRPRPGREHVRHRALFNTKAADELAQVLALALGDPRLPTAPAAVAEARLAFVAELDSSRPGSGPGPGSGLVGPLSGSGDPRRAPLFVTTVESIAQCGWQAFLGRALRLEPAPDPQGALVGVDPRWVGGVVHAVLEGIARDSLALPAGEDETPALAQVLTTPGAPLRWPDPDGVKARCEQAARALAAEEGLAIPGFWRILAIRSLPMLEVARIQDQENPVDAVLGAELAGRAEVPTATGPRVVHFRVDRVDRLPDGRLRLLDFKTGRPVSDKRKAESREAELLIQTASGRRLQAALYVRSCTQPSLGSYLALRADGLEPADPARLASVPGEHLGQDAFDEALDQAASAAIEAWESGALLPRLVDAAGETPPACAFCELRQACSQGDSSARRRQLSWAEEGRTRLDEPHRQAQRLWWLGQKVVVEPTSSDEGGEG